MQPSKTILLVEDDDDLRRYYRQAFTLKHFSVTEARGGFEALRKIENNRPDAIVLDLLMPGLDGFGVLEELATHPPAIPTVIVTGAPGDHENLAVHCVLKKPATADRVIRAVEECLDLDG